jgi:hypothetical protein
MSESLDKTYFLKDAIVIIIVDEESNAFTPALPSVKPFCPAENFDCSHLFVFNLLNISQSHRNLS